MKIKLNKWIGLMAGTLVLLAGLNSCLKNRNVLATDFSKVTNVVDLPVNGFKALAFNVTPDPQVVNIYVELGGPLLDKDVQVTLVYDPLALVDYNAAHTDTTVTPTNPNPSGDVTHYVQLPDSAFTLPTLTATIKKGERLSNSIMLTIVPTKVDLSGQFAIPLKLVDAQGIAIADNLKSVIYAVGVKNPYDGIYKSEGVFTHPAYGVLTWVFADGITQQLVTTGPKSVSMYPTNTSIGGFGAELDITVNSDNTIAEVFNGVTTPVPNADHYDPATKTFYVSGGYVGASGPRTYKATLVYTGPRP